DAVRFPRLEFRRVPDIGRRDGFRVLAARPVTGFASPGFKSALLIFLHHLVWALLKRVSNVLMACLADFGAGILSRLVLRAAKSGGEQQARHCESRYAAHILFSGLFLQDVECCARSVADIAA